MGKSNHESLYLSEDIMLMILLHLPAKALLRFKSVCKSWRELISDESFARSHINQSNANNEFHVELLMCSHATLQFYASHYSRYLLSDADADDDDDDINLITNSRTFFPSPLYLRSYFYVGGCCDGLICLFKALSALIYLWNPVLNQCRTIQTKEDSDFRNVHYTHFVGFGFDCQNQDYKVVRLFQSYLSSGKLEVELYSSKKNSWKLILCPITSEPICEHLIRPCSSVVFNSRLHWIGGYVVYDDYWGVGEPSRNFVHSFEFVDEKLNLFPMPCSELGTGSRLGVLNGCLSFINIDVSRTGWEVWSMRRYGSHDSWSKDAFVPLIGYPIGISPSGNILLRKGDVVFAYDIVGKKRLKKLEITVSESGKFRDHFVAKYVPSLISVSL